MRVLLIGASGQLGRALSVAFSSNHHVIEAVRRNPTAGQVTIDLNDRPATLAALLDAKPDAVLIAGAFCHVDLCETEQETCRRVNVRGPQTVAEYAQDHGGRVVFYSTDQVFDGARDSYGETDRIAPLNVYAQSKAEGEAVLRKVLPDRHLVLRTAWLYGPDAAHRNFVLRLIKRVAVGEDVPIPADQWGTPTYTDDLARATLFLVERGLSGTFHATGPERINRLSLARKVCSRFGLDARRLIPKPTRDLGQAAPRPLRVFLDCRKIQAAGTEPFRGLDAGLEALYAWHVAERENRGSQQRVARPS